MAPPGWIFCGLLGAGKRVSYFPGLSRSHQIIIIVNCLQTPQAEASPRHRRWAVHADGHLAQPWAGWMCGLAKRPPRVASIGKRHRELADHVPPLLVSQRKFIARRAELRVAQKRSRSRAG